MKKIILLLPFLIFHLTIPNLTWSIPGDVNNDGNINSVDALQTAQYGTGLYVEGFDAEAADVNGDGSVNIVDALMIARYSVGLLDVFPASILSISKAPVVELPTGVTGEILVEKSEMATPDKIENYFIPIGHIYDITFNGQDSTDFGENQAQITFNYDLGGIRKHNLIPEFRVFYYDEIALSWEKVDKIVVDYDNSTVTVYITHFTPFVLSAIPSTTGTTVADPPAAIYDDFPSGIGGSGNTIFTVVDENFKYYQDREYFIYPTSVSSANAEAFSALGLEGALGISTINGDSSLGTFAEHKQYTGDDYIIFTAHMDIDLYLMYDTRGGIDRYDTSEDAPWIAEQGFENTGYFLQTTDNVTYYTVYKKTYLKGEEIRLHGNRKGVPGPIGTGIDTNYWLILKREGVTAVEPVSAICNNADTIPPANVTKLKAVTRENSVYLTWQNPTDTDFVGTIIRKNTTAAPATVNDGYEPVGEVFSSQFFQDTDIVFGTTYYYSVFSLDENYNYAAGTSISITPNDPQESPEEWFIIDENGILTGFNEDEWDQNVTDIVIPATINGISVVSIGDNAFGFCKSLTSISIPDSVTEIKDRAFYYCSNLTIITIPDSVTFIGNEAFISCTSLTAITIPDSVTSIGEKAFNQCSDLEEIIIPTGITSILDMTFMDCRSLTTVTIPESVTSIGAGAFGGCSHLTSITIPESVTSIGEGAFARCGFEEIRIPSRVTAIKRSTFSWCWKLKSISIPDNITFIGTHAFDRCSKLESVSISASIDTIENYVFYDCVDLKTVTIHAVEPPQITTGPNSEVVYPMFESCVNLTAIYVPSESVDEYKTAENWSQYAGLIQPIK